MTTAIRPARATDIAALVALENSAFDADRISPRGFRGLVGSASALVLVAVGAGTIAGYCAILFRAGSLKARLYSLAVAAGGQGLGARLLEAAEDAARARGCQQMRLEVRADNGRALALYERCGYLLFGQVPDYYADGAAALRLRKSLLPAPRPAI